MGNNDEHIEGILEKHGIGQIEQPLPYSASVTNAGSDVNEADSTSESDSSTSSIKPVDREDSPISS
jgi:hypothetical protein